MRVTETKPEVYLEFAKGLAAEAGVIMRRYFRAEDIGTEWKEDNTPLTVADTKINQLVIDRVKKGFPEHGVIGEEDSYETKRDYVWVVDPIDGTIAFSMGIPVSSFCMALVYKGDVQVSVVFEPFQDRLFSAVLGQGAFMNGQKINVSKYTDVKNKYFMGVDWMSSGQKNLGPAIETLKKQQAKLLSELSFSFMGALVAKGDMFAAFMAYGSPWDAAAISLIVEEAGGKATDLEGNARKYNQWSDGIIVTNGTIHDEIVRMTKHADTWN